MRTNLLFIVVIVLFIGFNQSCTHDSLIMEEMDSNPIDTMVVDTMNMDTMIVDTVDIGNPCDSNLIYFDKDVLPILQSNCAFSGCHDAGSASDGVILDSYEQVIATTDVVPFDLQSSIIYKVLTEDDPNDVMPPTGKLANEQINTIALWILQGAEDLICDEDVEECNLESISYGGFVKNIFANTCNVCHSTTTAFGGIVLDNYEGVKATVDAGRLFGAINWNQGFSNMPQGQSQLDSCTISKIKSWIDEGAENN